MKPGRILQIAVSVVLLVVLVRWIDGPSFLRAVRGADPGLLVVGLLIALANRALMALKWNLLLVARDLRVGWWRAVRVYWSSTFLGLFLPATVGADVVRAVMLSRSESRRAEIVSSILVERFLGMVALGLFGVVGAALAPAVLGKLEFDRQKLLLLACAAAVAVTAAFAFSLTDAAGRLAEGAAARFAGKRHAGRIAEVLVKVFRSFRAYRENRGALTLFFVLTLLENFFPMVRAYLVARAMHVDVPFLFFASMVPIELLVIRLPLSVDGFGIREGLFTWFLAQRGIDESLGFAVGLVNHVLFLLAVLPGGVMHFLGERRPPAAETAPTGGPGR